MGSEHGDDGEGEYLMCSARFKLFLLTNSTRELDVKQLALPSNALKNKMA
jgi:hypothetical protein